MNDGDASSVARTMASTSAKEVAAIERNTKALEGNTTATKSKGGGGSGPRSPGAPAGSPTGDQGGQMMNGSLASVPSYPSTGSSRMAGGMNMLSGALAAVGGIAKIGMAAVTGASNLMPEIQPTINREAQFYNASVSGGGGMSRQGLRQATFNAMKGGMTSVGSDGMVGEFLASRGMVTDSTRGSTYMQTVRSVSNAAKYLNMSNDRAAVAVEGLTSGTTSRSMLQNLGIYTSDLKTGKAKTQGQIMGEIGDRLSAGRGTATADQVNESFRRGNLGASLAGLGLSEDQQQIMRQYLVEKAKGNNMDLSNDKDMEKLANMAGVNPNQSGMTITGMQTGAMNKAAEPYIKGMQDAVPAMEALTTASGNLAAQFGEAKAAIETVAGSREGGAVIGALKDAMEGLTETIGGLVTAVTGLIGMLGAGGALGSAMSAAGTAIAGGAATAVGAFSAFAAAAVASQVGREAAMNWAVDEVVASPTTRGNFKKADYQATVHMGTSDSGGMAVVAPTGSTPKQALALTEDSQTWLKKNPKWAKAHPGDIPDFWAQTFQRDSGGQASTINANGITGSADKKGKLTFIMPVQGKITDGFGPRTPPTPTASSFHRGVDIAAGEGSPIIASAEGQVIFCAPDGSYGNVTRIKHPNGYTTVYAHQSRIGVRSGQNVRQGENIGAVGTTGNSTGPHLHFEVRDAGGAPIDPMKVIGGAFNMSSSSAAGDNKHHTSGGSGSGAKDLSSIIDQRAKQKGETPAALGGMGAGGSRSGGADTFGAKISSLKGAMKGSNTSSGNNNLSNNRMSISLPGAPSAKTGDSYVAQDGPVNVHAGEAILNADEAANWRRSKTSGGKGGGSNVTINVSVAQASESEARRFATMIKQYIDQDDMINRMGSK